MTNMRRRLRSQRGASSIELVLYTPIMFFAIFAFVQLALTWHANQIASAVARESARIARIEGGGPAALARAEQHGERYAVQIGGDSLREIDVSVEPVGADQVRATVSGRGVEIISGLSPRVSQTIQGPIEQFRPDL